MENLSIKKINSTITNNLIRIGDLVYFEGPLLALFEDANNGHLYLFDWVDRDNIYNRWLVYRVSPSALFSFITKQISHFELFKSNPDNKFYTADIETKHKITDYALSEINEIPENYFPNAENYFDEAESPLLMKIRATAVKALSRKKQDNEYFPSEYFIQTLTHTSIKRNWFNKINPSHYGAFQNNSNLIVVIPSDMEFEFDNQYNPMRIFNSNINLTPRVKKMNKMYA